MNKNKIKKFKIVLLGGSDDGKSCIIYAYFGMGFNENRIATIGTYNYNIIESIDGRDYNFIIYDTAGQERYKSISEKTIDYADGILIVFDVSDGNSLKHIDYWINAIKEKRNKEDIAINLVGNKIDKDKRVISHEEALIIAQKNNIKYFETSAKTGRGIREAFHGIQNDIYQKYLNKNPEIKEIIEKEKLIKEREQKEKEMKEKEILEKERLKKEKEQKEKKQREMKEKEKLEKERLKKEKQQKEKEQRELKEKEKMEKIEKEKKEKEKMEKEKKENEIKEKKLKLQNFFENDKIFLNNYLKKFISY